MSELLLPSATWASSAELEQRARLLFERSSEALLLVHGDELLLVDCNSAAERLLRLSRLRAAGRRLAEFAEPSQPLDMAALLAGAAPQSVLLRASDGEPIACDVESLLVGDHSAFRYVRLIDRRADDERRMRRRQLAFTLTQMTTLGDADAVLRFLACTLVAQLDGAAAWIWTELDGAPKVAATACSVRPLPSPIEAKLLWRLVDEAATLESENLAQEAWCPDPLAFTAARLPCLALVPLAQGDRHLGAVALLSNLPLDEDAREHLDALAGHAAVLIGR